LKSTIWLRRSALFTSRIAGVRRCCCRGLSQPAQPAGRGMPSTGTAQRRVALSALPKESSRTRRAATSMLVSEAMIATNNGKPALFEELRRLEVELHAYGMRRNRKRIDALLHPDFFETDATLTPVHSQHLDLTTLADGAALGAAGTLHRFTLRSSVWIRTDAGWKMRFHQGTPTKGAPRAGTTPMAAAQTPE